MDDDDVTREDLKLPTEMEVHAKFVKKFMADYDAGKDLIVSVTKSMG
jgi:hypothetical protein